MSDDIHCMAGWCLPALHSWLLTSFSSGVDTLSPVQSGSGGQHINMSTRSTRSTSSSSARWATNKDFQSEICGIIEVHSSSLSLDIPDHELVSPSKDLPRKKSAVYRMASSFELGDEQMFTKKMENKKKTGKDFGKFRQYYYKAIYCEWSFVFLIPAATFQHLFGPPTPAAVRRMRNKKFYEGDTPSVRKSKKPLPGESQKITHVLESLTFNYIWLWLWRHLESIICENLQSVSNCVTCDMFLSHSINNNYLLRNCSSVSLSSIIRAPRLT